MAVARTLLPAAEWDPTKSSLDSSTSWGKAADDGLHDGHSMNYEGFTHALVGMFDELAGFNWTTKSYLQLYNLVYDNITAEEAEEDEARLYRAHDIKPISRVETQAKKLAKLQRADVVERQKAEAASHVDERNRVTEQDLAHIGHQQSRDILLSRYASEERKQKAKRLLQASIHHAAAIEDALVSAERSVRQEADHELEVRLGPGRLAVSEIEPLNISVNLV